MEPLRLAAILETEGMRSFVNLCIKADSIDTLLRDDLLEFIETVYLPSNESEISDSNLRLAMLYLDYADWDYDLALQQYHQDMRKNRVQKHTWRESDPLWHPSELFLVTRSYFDALSVADSPIPDKITVQIDYSLLQANHEKFFTGTILPDHWFKSPKRSIVELEECIQENFVEHEDVSECLGQITTRQSAAEKVGKIHKSWFDRLSKLKKREFAQALRSKVE